MRRAYLLLVSFFCLSLTLSSANAGPETTDFNYPRVPQGLILSLTGTHYPGIAQALSSVGFQVREVSAAGYLSSERTRDTFLIVPEQEGWQLGSTFLPVILHDVGHGTPLLLDGATPLAAKLGLAFIGTRGRMKRYRWKHNAEELIRLPGRLKYSRYKGNPSLKVLADNPQTREPLVVAGNLEQGRFIYSALPLEPPQGLVYEYLPFLAQAIVDEFQITPTLAADNLCAYFDPSDFPIWDATALAIQLKSWGVREVHLGAWNESEKFREFTRRFIEAAHLEGITVCAWLEFPMVGEAFWDQHPKWREVTASGRPALMDWRHNMALEDPDCFRAVVDRTQRLLLDFDWDGVDLAELYFEAAGGVFKDPTEFTPMHPAFRKMFQQRYGADPLEIFNPRSAHYWRRSPKMRRALIEYRIELITQLTKTFLDTLARCQEQKPYLQTTLTFVDSIYDPSVKERFAVDADRLLALQEKYDFTVEVEDPYTVWNSGPDRYRVIGEYYRPRLHPGTPFSIDINIADRMPPVHPLLRPRGLELYALVAAVAANTDLVTIFGVDTFVPDDMRLIPFVLGAQQVIGEVIPRCGTVQAQRQLYWRTDTRGRTAYLDGQKWPCLSDSQVLIPAGAHTVSTRPQPENAESNALRIESINGKVLGAERDDEQVTLTYESRGRCYVTLSRKPTTLLCDGAPYLGEFLSNGKHVCLVLPPGKHTVVME